MRTFTPPKCESCISYDHIKCSCREESSPLFGGNISPLHLACSSFIGLSKVYAPKNRVKFQSTHPRRVRPHIQQMSEYHITKVHYLLITCNFLNT